MIAPIKLSRLSDTPLLQARRDVPWERGAVLNTAALRENGHIHLFYRAIEHEPGWQPGAGGTYRTSVGHAWSSSGGLAFERGDEPVLPVGFGGDTTEAEDCRIVKIDGLYYLTYCLWDSSVGRPTPGYSVSRDLKTWEHCGELVPFAQYGYNKNAVLFPEKIGGRFALLHRPEAMAFRHLPEANFSWRTWSRCDEMTPAQRPGVTLSFSDDLKHWTDTRVLLQPREGLWDDNKVGPGAPPMRTPSGWLNVYHGVSKDHVYRLGLALHDLADPSIVLKRQEACLLEPELDWEREGDVDNVVFTCGALLEGSRLRVYYAGADTAIGAAEADVSEFLR
jgi:predicted GH43/DUF377 family glycosyl hydrolase